MNRYFAPDWAAQNPDGQVAVAAAASGGAPVIAESDIS
jgi:hypothetical protein